MPFSPSRRTLSVLTVAALLALASPGNARALPIDGPGEPRGLVRQLLDGAAAWTRSFLAHLWQADEGDARQSVDPDGQPTSNGDAGSGLNPDG